MAGEWREKLKWSGGWWGVDRRGWVEGGWKVGGRWVYGINEHLDPHIPQIGLFITLKPLKGPKRTPGDPLGPLKALKPL
jgi:hypothetical protein